MIPFWCLTVQFMTKTNNEACKPKLGVVTWHFDHPYHNSTSGNFLLLQEWEIQDKFIAWKENHIIHVLLASVQSHFLHSHPLQVHAGSFVEKNSCKNMDCSLVCVHMGDVNALLSGYVFQSHHYCQMYKMHLSVWSCGKRRPVGDEGHLIWLFKFPTHGSLSSM